MVVEIFRSNQAFKWPTSIQPQKPQWNSFDRKWLFLWMENCLHAMRHGFCITPTSGLFGEGECPAENPTVPCACDSTACEVWRENPDGARPIRR